MTQMKTPAPGMRAGVGKNSTGDAGWRLIAENQIQNHTSANGNQHIVTTGLNPMVATRRCAQTVFAPVIDDVLVAAIFRWQPVAAMIRMLRSGATLTFVMILTCHWCTAVIVTIFVTVATAAIIIVLIISASLNTVLCMNHGQGTHAHHHGEQRGKDRLV